jgi:hypothetical protein
LLLAVAPALSPSASINEEWQTMKPTHLNDPFHNPFHNRFHVPVHSRLDEMQAYTQMVWLKDPAPSSDGSDNNQHARRWRRALAGAFALLLVVAFSAAVVSNAFGN